MRARFLAALLSAVVVCASAVAVGQTGDGGTASTATPATPAAEPTATPPAEGSTAAPAATPPPQQMTGEQYVVRLRDLEQRINELKEEIFRSKARLSLLAESVLQNVVGGARAIIQHTNEMGPSFRLIRAVYALDGAPILTRADENGSLSDAHEFPVYNGAIGSGDHSLTVNLEYQGNGYGIFQYVKNYSFRVRSTQSFTVPEGKAIRIQVLAYEKGGPTTPPEERPAVRYITRVMTLREAQEADQAANGGSSGSGSSAAPASGGTTPAASTTPAATPSSGSTSGSGTTP